MPTIAPDDTPTLDPVADALHAYRTQAWQLQDIERGLNRIEGLPPLYKAAAAAVTLLAGLRPHHVVGEPRRTDAQSFRRDLEFIARTVDLLLKAYADEAAQHFPGVDKSLFEDVLLKALFTGPIPSIERAGDAKECEARATRLVRYTDPLAPEPANPHHFVNGYCVEAAR
jgi:hypothetical protein